VTPPENTLQGPLADELKALQGSSWWPWLQRWVGSAAGRSLMAALDARVAAGARVYPASVFKALALTPAARVRVLILGQDPYHGPGQAEGLAFSVPNGQRCPPSLRNIFKELQRDLGLSMPAGQTSLAPWARQGVLLLNTSLTVEDGQAGSHSKLGWQALTDEIVKSLIDGPGARVFMLWGAHAHAQAGMAAQGADSTQLGRHLFLRSNHPSPLSALRGPAPFIGCGHFGQANRWLQQQGQPAVDWQLPAP
jgi:uracil-DNA glycosylase